MQGIYRIERPLTKEVSMNLSLFLSTVDAVVVTCTAIRDAAGVDTPCATISVGVVSGPGSFSLNDRDGNPLPANAVRLISADTPGDTVYDFVLNTADGRSFMEQNMVTTVPPPFLAGVYSVGAIEPK